MVVNLSEKSFHHLPFLSGTKTFYCLSVYIEANDENAMQDMKIGGSRSFYQSDKYQVNKIRKRSSQVCTVIMSNACLE